MISLDEATKNWATAGVWKIAPPGLDWIKEGARARIGEWASIGEWAHDAIDLGLADGYRKCIAQIDGVAWIGAGCRWFTLTDAITHWTSKADQRELTLCLLESAKCIARLNGWQFEEAK